MLSSKKRKLEETVSAVCICGEELQLTTPAETYGKDKEDAVSCSYCKKWIKPTDIFYHCTEKFKSCLHEYGYDLHIKCVDKSNNLYDEPSSKKQKTEIKEIGILQQQTPLTFVYLVTKKMTYGNCYDPDEIKREIIAIYTKRSEANKHATKFYFSHHRDWDLPLKENDKCCFNLQ